MQPSIHYKTRLLVKALDMKCTDNALQSIIFISLTDPLEAARVKPTLRKSKPTKKLEDEFTIIQPSFRSVESIQYSEDQFKDLDVSHGIQTLADMMDETRQMMQDRKQRKQVDIGKSEALKKAMEEATIKTQVKYEEFAKIDDTDKIIDRKDEQYIIARDKERKEQVDDQLKPPGVIESLQQKAHPIDKHVRQLISAEQLSSLERLISEEKLISSEQFELDDVVKDEQLALDDVLKDEQLVLDDVVKDEQLTSEAKMKARENLNELANIIIVAYDKYITDDYDKFSKSLKDALQTILVGLSRKQATLAAKQLGVEGDEDSSAQEMLIEMITKADKEEGESAVDDLATSEIRQVLQGLKTIFMEKNQMHMYTHFTESLLTYQKSIRGVVPTHDISVTEEDEIAKAIKAISETQLITISDTKIASLQSINLLTNIVQEIAKIAKSASSLELVSQIDDFSGPSDVSLLQPKLEADVDKLRPDGLHPEVGEDEIRDIRLISEPEVDKTDTSALFEVKSRKRSRAKKRKTAFFDSLLKQTPRSDIFQKQEDGELFDMMAEINKIIGDERGKAFKTFEELSELEISRAHILDSILRNKSEEEKRIEISETVVDIKVTDKLKTKSKKRDSPISKPYKKKKRVLKPKKKQKHTKPTLRRTLFDTIFTYEDTTEDTTPGKRYVSQALQWLDKWESLKDDRLDSRKSSEDLAEEKLDDIDSVLLRSRRKKRIFTSREQESERAAESEEAERYKLKEASLLSITAHTSLGKRISLEGLIEKLAGVSTVNYKREEKKDSFRLTIDTDVIEWDRRFIWRQSRQYSAINLWSSLAQRFIATIKLHSFIYEGDQIGRSFNLKKFDLFEARVSKMYNRNVFLSIVRDHEIDADDPLENLTMAERRHFDASICIRFLQDNLKEKLNNIGYQPVWTKGIKTTTSFYPIRRLNMDEIMEFQSSGEDYTSKVMKKLLLERQNALKPIVEKSQVKIPSVRYSKSYLLRYLRIWASASKKTFQEDSKKSRITCKFPFVQFSKTLSSPFYSYLQLQKKHKQKYTNNKKNEYVSMPKII
ncbi:hypothetical protein GJ496_009341 [Pomphorhynchus laevis]|nr:hypothetical protein GJ496_009341 [Pomphorhynchus laevis]